VFNTNISSDLTARNVVPFFSVRNAEEFPVVLGKYVEL